MKKEYLLFLVLLLSPVILAYILHFPIIGGCEIAGTESDWVGFWGNYSGGILSGLISFYILSKTLKHNHNENRNTQKHNSDENRKQREYAFYEQLRHDIAERYSHLNLLHYVGTIIPPQQQLNACYEIDKLERWHENILNDLNSFIILYDGKVDSIIEEYESVVEAFSDKITQLIMLYRKYLNAQNDTEKQKCYDEIKGLINNLEDLKKSMKSLWEHTQDELNRL